ncbi:12157_t:CDS:2 [Acaulospora colombiana]|uniref:12157_t:CDS:1 n=1 Tax=Acaulospora colombiana TaxID=27376 RepID=A0ACA9LLN2_9GLOM|nr:12157_t:CDS:2 [Acaulospora colombiana]
MSQDPFLRRLSQDLTELLEEGDDYNIIIEAGDAPNNKFFRLHSMILRHRSPYFRRKLLDMSKVVEIKKNHIPVEVFSVIVRYMYGGLINLDELEPSMILQLLCAAEEIELEELVIYIESFLLDNHTEWLRQNFALINRTCFRYEGFRGLQRFCTGIIAQKPEMIFESDDFTIIQESALVSLLQRDDLRMEECTVWEHVLRWGISQTLTITSSPETWSRDDFSALKSTLKNCLPWIRYFQMSPGQFYDKVLPYEKILPKTIFKELLQHFLIPDRPLNTIPLAPRSSTIITSRHAALISSWIDHNSRVYEINENPYEFKLLLRGSRDGFRAKKFHELCEDKQRTVCVIRVHGTGEIIGGYNPTSWGKSGYGQTTESFIFALDDIDLKNSIKSRVKNMNYALDYYSYYGPTFGGRDLALEDNFNEEARGYCKKKHYEKSIRKTEEPFKVHDYEIFQVLDKSFS